MLSAAISPIALPQNYNAEELSQAFAMTMLASYANVALDSRTIQSFANSYGVAQLWQMPAVPLVTPPVTIAKIPYPWGNHVIIALAGTPNGASLVAQWWNSSFAVTSTNPVGKVHHMYNVAATAVATAIAAVPALVTLLADPRTEVTFTGYSFGAAVADLMASSMICLAPTRKVRLRKFASPRCGNLQYYANTPAQLNTVSVYRQNDGVFTTPYTAVRSSVVLGVPVVSGLFCRYAVDPSSRVWDWGGVDIGRPPVSNGTDEAAFISSFLGGVSFNNDSYNHLSQSYRLMMLCRLNQENNNLPKYRFKYLEFPDDNRWQTQAAITTQFNPAWIGHDSPAPAAFDVQDGDANALRLHNAQPVPVIPPVPALSEFSTGGGGDIVDSSISGSRRRNRHAPVGGS